MEPVADYIEPPNFLSYKFFIDYAIAVLLNVVFLFFLFHVIMNYVTR